MKNVGVGPVDVLRFLRRKASSTRNLGYSEEMGYFKPRAGQKPALVFEGVLAKVNVVRQMNIELASFSVVIIRLRRKS